MIPIAICGCGALGSRIALELAAPGIDFHLYDNDRVREENLGTSLYTRYQIGKLKVDCCASLVKSLGGIPSIVEDRDITKRWLPDKDSLIVDCLDNAEARNYVQREAIGGVLDIVHVGVADGVGEVIWGEVQPYTESADVQICTHQLGRSIISLTASVAAISIRRWIQSQQRTNYLVNASGVVLASTGH